MAVGTAEVKAVFGAGKRRVAGCLVTDGRMMKGQLISVKRGKAVVSGMGGGIRMCHS